MIASPVFWFRADRPAFAQLQARDHFTLILGFVFCSKLKSLLRLRNAERQYNRYLFYLHLCLSVMLYSLSW